MGQINKVISVFLLLAVAIFVLWLMLTKTQAMREIFTGKTPLTQMFSKDKPQTTPTPTISQNPNEQGGFVAQAQQKFGTTTTTESKEQTKGGGNVLGAVQTLTPAPKATSYPKTGAGAIFLPLTLLGFVAGKYMLKTTATK